MDRVNHLWPDVAALVPKTTNPAQCSVAWLFASRDTAVALPGCVRMKKRRGVAVTRCQTVGPHSQSGMEKFAACVIQSTPHERECFDSHTHPKTVMRWAAKYGHVSVLRFVQRWGFPLAVVDATALYWAGCYGRMNILEFVMAWKHASPAEATAPEQTLVKGLCRFWEELTYAPTLMGMCADQILAGAAAYGQIDVLAWLKRWGLSQGNVRRNHNAALRWAAECGRVNALQFLKDNWGLTATDARSLDNYALIGAAQRGHANVLTFMKHAWGLGTSDARAQEGAALRLAIKFGGVAVLQVLKEQYGLTLADVRAHDTHALRTAAVYDRVPVLHFLKNWRDSPAGTAYGLGHLTLDDVRVQENFVLRTAIRYDRVAMLQFLREWRDPDNSRLTRQDLRMAIDPRVMVAGKGRDTVSDATNQLLGAWMDELAQSD